MHIKQSFVGLSLYNKDWNGVPRRVRARRGPVPMVCIYESRKLYFD